MFSHGKNVNRIEDAFLENFSANRRSSACLSSYKTEMPTTRLFPSLNSLQILLFMSIIRLLYSSSFFARLVGLLPNFWSFFSGLIHARPLNQWKNHFGTISDVFGAHGATSGLAAPLPVGGVFFGDIIDVIE